MRIKYNKNWMSLNIEWTWKGKEHYKYLTCPFAVWWKAKKYFKPPKFKFYFGPISKREWSEGNNELGIKPGYIYRQCGYYPYASSEYVKSHTSKWFPIFIDSNGIGWKDKYEIPQYERTGYFTIIFGRNPNTAWQFLFIPDGRRHSYTFIKDNNELTINNTYSDEYWEMILWFNEYANKDIKTAFKSFPNGAVTTSVGSKIKNIDISDISVTSIEDNKYIKFTLNNVDTVLYGDMMSMLNSEDRIRIVFKDNINVYSSYIKVDSYNESITCFFEYEKICQYINNTENINEVIYYHYYELYDSWINEFLTEKAKKELK